MALLVFQHAEYPYQRFSRLYIERWKSLPSSERDGDFTGNLNLFRDLTVVGHGIDQIFPIPKPGRGVNAWKAASVVLHMCMIRIYGAAGSYVGIRRYHIFHRLRVDLLQVANRQAVLRCVGGRVIRLFIGGFNSGCNNHLAGNRENADIHAVRFGIPANIRVDQLRELPAGDIVGPAAGRVGVDDGRGGLRAVGVGICFASMPAANAPNRFIVKPLSQVGHLYCFKDTVMSLYAVPSS